MFGLVVAFFGGASEQRQKKSDQVSHRKQNLAAHVPQKLGLTRFSCFVSTSFPFAEQPKRQEHVSLNEQQEDRTER